MKYETPVAATPRRRMDINLILLPTKLQAREGRTATEEDAENNSEESTWENILQV
jgi:hypothetical protein